jgi:hypothetical protein
MFAGNEHARTMSGGFMEEMFETLFALAITAAICIGVISLSVHLNEARIARGPAAGTTQAAATTEPSGVARAPTASNFN